MLSIVTQSSDFPIISHSDFTIPFATVCLYGPDRRLSLRHGLCDLLVFKCDSKESIPGHFECFVSDRLFSKQTLVERSDQIFAIEVTRAIRTSPCMFG